MDPTIQKLARRLKGPAPAMRKLQNIDSVEHYDRTGELPFLIEFRSRRRPNPRWIEQVFTPAQLTLLNRLGYIIRPHPRRRSIVELYILDDDLTERDWTAIRLLF